MKYQFSLAIQNNIEQTYTYAHVKGAHNYGGDINDYNPLEFFESYLEEEPFKAFMELDRYGFKNTLNTLNRYQIPFTPEQERRARIYYEVTEQMAKERSDSVHRYVEGDLSTTGIVKLTDSYLLTTESTIRVAKFLKHLPKHKVTSNVIYEHKLSKEIMASKEQYQALETSLSNHVSCIIGGAGTGKSFVTAEVVHQLHLNKQKVEILAPTHKAKEALQEKLKGGTVRTVHSFVHQNQTTTQDVDVIVIDEAGMLSTPLFNQLRNVYSGQQLIFIGDKNQLPPIEYGRPFELIQEQFHTTELKANHRSEARDIISLGKQVLGESQQNANMPIHNIEVTQSAKQAFDRGAEVILTYTNANVKAINEQRRIQQGVASLYHGFKIGEKIIAKTNYKNKFYNGQLFEVVGHNSIEDISTGKVIYLDSPKEFEYNFDYAYALTIHKSQGSEWEVVGYLPSKYDTANLAYVAITRAKKKLLIVNGLNESYPKDRKWRQLYEDYEV